MLHRMSFGDNRQLRYLRLLGRVYTIRDIDYATDTATVPQLKNARVQRRKLATFRFGSWGASFDLTPYLQESGFSSVDDWLAAAEYHRTTETERRPYHLWQVWQRGGLPKQSRSLAEFEPMPVTRGL